MLALCLLAAAPAPAADADGDNLPDEWEAQWVGEGRGRYGSIAELLPQNNEDKDGLTNLKEYQQGKSPLAPDTASHTPHVVTLEEGEFHVFGPRLEPLGSFPAPSFTQYEGWLTDDAQNGFWFAYRRTDGVLAVRHYTGLSSPNAQGVLTPASEPERISPFAVSSVWAATRVGAKLYVVVRDAANQNHVAVFDSAANNGAGAWQSPLVALLGPGGAFEYPSPDEYWGISTGPIHGIAHRRKSGELWLQYTTGAAASFALSDFAPGAQSASRQRIESYATAGFGNGRQLAAWSPTQLATTDMNNYGQGPGQVRVWDPGEPGLGADHPEGNSLSLRNPGKTFSLSMPALADDDSASPLPAWLAGITTLSDGRVVLTGSDPSLLVEVPALSSPSAAPVPGRPFLYSEPVAYWGRSVEVNALFLPADDQDLDGLPDSWERQWVGEAPGQHASIEAIEPEGNEDKDAWSHQEEHAFGTNPTWPDSPGATPHLITLTGTQFHVFSDSLGRLGSFPAGEGVDGNDPRWLSDDAEGGFWMAHRRNVNGVLTLALRHYQSITPPTATAPRTVHYTDYLSPFPIEQVMAAKRVGNTLYMAVIKDGGAAGTADNRNHLALFNLATLQWQGHLVKLLRLDGSEAFADPGSNHWHISQGPIYGMAHRRKSNELWLSHSSGDASSFLLSDLTGSSARQRRYASWASAGFGNGRQMVEYSATQLATVDSNYYQANGPEAPGADHPAGMGQVRVWDPGEDLLEPNPAMVPERTFSPVFPVSTEFWGYPHGLTRMSDGRWVVSTGQQDWLYALPWGGAPPTPPVYFTTHLAYPEAVAEWGKHVQVSPRFLGNDQNFDGVEDPPVDSDHDGLSDAEEFALRTNPGSADTDGDGVSDGAERDQHTDPHSNHDTDGDGLPDDWEQAWGLNPNRSDHHTWRIGTGAKATEVFALSQALVLSGKQAAVEELRSSMKWELRPRQAFWQWIDPADGSAHLYWSGGFDPGMGVTIEREISQGVWVPVGYASVEAGYFHFVPAAPVEGETPSPTSAPANESTNFRQRGQVHSNESVLKMRLMKASAAVNRRQPGFPSLPFIDPAAPASEPPPPTRYYLTETWTATSNSGGQTTGSSGDSTTKGKTLIHPATRSVNLSIEIGSKSSSSGASRSGSKAYSWGSEATFTYHGLFGAPAGAPAIDNIEYQASWGEENTSSSAASAGSAASTVAWTDGADYSYSCSSFYLPGGIWERSDELWTLAGSGTQKVTPEPPPDDNYWVATATKGKGTPAGAVTKKTTFRTGPASEVHEDHYGAFLGVDDWRIAGNLSGVTPISTTIATGSGSGWSEHRILSEEYTAAQFIHDTLLMMPLLGLPPDDLITTGTSTFDWSGSSRYHGPMDWLDESLPVPPRGHTVSERFLSTESDYAFLLRSQWWAEFNDCLPRSVVIQETEIRFTADGEGLPPEIVRVVTAQSGSRPGESSRSSPIQSDVTTENVNVVRQVGLLPVETVTINTFIPHNNVEDPRPFNGTLYKGDNRNAGNPSRATWNENGSHRTQQKFQVIADQALDANGLVDNAYGPDADGQGHNDRFVDIGETKSFDPDTSVDGAGNLTAAALADNANGAPLMIAKATAPKGEVWIESTTYLGPKKIAIKCRCEGANPLVTFGPVPTISYTITITIDKAAGTYTIAGMHDGFPACEIYINGKRVYQHDPLATGDGPNSLFGDGEYEINEVAKPLP